MSDWKQETLKDLVDVDPDQLPSTTDPDYSFFYIDISSVSFGNVSLPNLSIKYKDAPSRARKILKDNDILMSTVRPNLKAFAQFRKRSKSNFIASTGFAVLRSKPNVEVGFIYHSLFSNEVEKQIEALVVGSNYPAINSGDVRNLKIIIPSFPIQQKIAKILSTCDSVIEQTQYAIAKYKAIKQGLLHDLFTRGLDANGKLRLLYEEAPELYKESKLGMIPKEWEVKRLEEIGDIITGSTPSTLNPQNFADKYQFISPADINGQQYILKSDKMLSEIGFSTSRRIPLNSICVVCIGSTIGKSAMTSVECCTNQQINTIVPFENTIALFYYYATKQYLTKQFAANMGLQAVPIVNKSTFQKFIIPIPNNQTEAILIQDKLITIDNKIQSEETLLQKYKSIKRGLMGDLLGGKKEV